MPLPIFLPPQIKDLPTDGYISKKMERRLDKTIKYVLVSGKKALEVGAGSGSRGEGQVRRDGARERSTKLGWVGGKHGVGVCLVCSSSSTACWMGTAGGPRCGVTCRWSAGPGSGQGWALGRMRLSHRPVGRGCTLPRPLLHQAPPDDEAWATAIANMLMTGCSLRQQVCCRQQGW